MKLWNKIELHENGLTNTTTSALDQTDEATQDDTFNMDDFITQTLGHGNENHREDCTMEQQIAALQYQKRVPATGSSFNVVHYWYCKRLEDERLWRIARVVFAAASTQASNERDFSHFNNVYTALRNRLSGNSTDTILKIKLNRDLFPAAVASVLSSAGA